MRAPRNLNQYTTADEAAKALEDMAAAIRQHAEFRPLVRYLVKLDYWNPDWSNPAKPRPRGHVPMDKSLKVFGCSN